MFLKMIWPSKQVLFLLSVNFIYVLFNVILCTESIFQITARENAFGLKELLKHPAIASLIISCLTFITIILGYIGTFTKIIRLSIFNVFLVVMLMCLQVIPITMTVRTRSHVQDIIKDQFLGDFNQQSNSIRNAIQSIQQRNRCCGVEGFEDYRPQNNPKEFYERVPNSCCDKSFSPNREIGSCTEVNHQMKKGCGNLILKEVLLGHNLIVLVILTVLVVLVQIFFIFASCFINEKFIDEEKIGKNQLIEMENFTIKKLASPTESLSDT